VFTSTFTFAKSEYDADFYRLDSLIAEAAKSIAGYLGEESWENPATGLVSTVYYWRTLQSLQTLMQHPAHLEAKAKQSRWLNGYHVVIAEVLATYGDSQIAHPLQNFHAPAHNRVR
jgi:heme-degrading monooxygenase HmoA